MMAIDELQAIRERYRPEPIRVLFVGESPPAVGTFFYLPFPALGHQRRYTSELMGVLHELQEAGILPGKRGLDVHTRVGEDC